MERPRNEEATQLLRTDDLALLPGRATALATDRLEARQLCVSPGFYRRSSMGLNLSSIGLGTGGFRGAEGDPPWRECLASVEAAIARGVNVFDTAGTYGAGSAEGILGAAIRRAVLSGAAAREAMVICSKGGYLNADDQSALRADDPPPWLADEVVAGYHSLSPAFLLRQLALSRNRLQVEHIDVWYLHNPEEQLVSGLHEFRRRVRRAFEVLEDALSQGTIGCYGVATAEGFQSTGAVFHELSEFHNAAMEVAGDGNGFKVLQVPINLGRTDAVFSRNQTSTQGTSTLLERAGDLGFTVISSVSLGGGRLRRTLIPPVLRASCNDLYSDVQFALEFARSLPGIATALAGMSKPRHVEENLLLARVAPVDLLAPS